MSLACVLVGCCNFVDTCNGMNHNLIVGNCLSYKITLFLWMTRHLLFSNFTVHPESHSCITEIREFFQVLGGYGLILRWAGAWANLYHNLVTI